MGEDTIIESRPVFNEKAEGKKGNQSWKHVTIGGVSGILMGAGAMYASKTLAQEAGAEQESESLSEEQALNQATSHDDLSFGEAFTAARAEVGPGGVFYWHGGIYNTYTADEWNSMTPEQKNDFAQQVKPEFHPDQIASPTDDNPDVEVHQVAGTTPLQETSSEDVQVVNQQGMENGAQGDEVNIVGYADADGHLVVAYDTTGDGQADVAIVDMDDNLQLSNPDLIYDGEGNVATVGDVINAQNPDPHQMTTTGNPDVTPDMPDFSNDADIEDFDIIA